MVLKTQNNKNLKTKYYSSINYLYDNSSTFLYDFSDDNTGDQDEMNDDAQSKSSNVVGREAELEKTENIKPETETKPDEEKQSGQGKKHR